MNSTAILVLAFATLGLACLQQIVDALSKIMHEIAPHTKTTLDDRIAARLDAFEADLKEVRSLLPTPPSTARKPEAGCFRPGLALAMATVALLAVGLASLPSCAGWASKGKAETIAGAKAATSCALDDIAKYGAAVYGDLGQDDFSGALAKLQKDYSLTQDAINCVVQAVIAAASAPTGSAAHGELPIAVIHGRQYIAEHGLVTTGALVPQ